MFGIDPMLITLTLAGVTVALAARRALIMLAVYHGVDRRRPVDVTLRSYPPPPEATPILAWLVPLGFRRLGETALDLPGHPTYVAWILVDPTGEIVAEVVMVAGVPALLTLTTAFRDGTVVETMYPIGESIHDADFHSGHVRSSVEAAYDEQRLHVARWRMRHGSAAAKWTMTEYLRGDAEYRERYGKRKLRRPLIVKQLLPSAAVIGCAAILTGFMLLRPVV